MKERPMIYTGDMVRALLREVDPKTMTRRVMKPQPPTVAVPCTCIAGVKHFYTRKEPPPTDSSEPTTETLTIKCPYGQPGDRLWVRETWAAEHYWDNKKPSEIPMMDPFNPKYKSPIAFLDTDWGGDRVGKTRSPIFLPRWASRILLEITAVRVERVQEITPIDAVREGCPKYHEYDNQGLFIKAISPLDRFHILWDSINAKRGYSWEANPWAWVVVFKRVQP